MPNEVQNLKAGVLVRQASVFGTLAFVVLLITAVYGAHGVYHRLKQSQETAFNQRAENVVRTLAELGGRYVAAFDWPLIEELVARAKEDPEVYSVQIEDALSQQTFGELDIGVKENTKQYVREINQDGRVDLLDVAPFIDLLSGN